MIKRGAVLLLVFLIIVSCKSREDRLNEAMKKMLEGVRSVSSLADGNRLLNNYFYRQIYSCRPEKVKEILEQGADPNYCLGDTGWWDSNPLSVVAETFYDTYNQGLYSEILGPVPDPVPDVETLNILLKAGADINQRPYIWQRVYTYNNINIERQKLEKKSDGMSFSPDEIQENIATFVADVNRLLEAFLEAGADPDKLGSPFPFSIDGWKAGITDKEANEYFAKGTRPINEAIKKGMWWESQVDLLLRYTTLDEASLEAARESKDPAMIEKITKLWNEQRESGQR